MMSDKGSLAEPSSRAGRLRLRKENAGFREPGIGDGRRGGDEGGDEGADESSESSCSASEENKAFSAAGGLEGVVTEEAGSSREASFLVSVGALAAAVSSSRVWFSAGSSAYR